MLNILVLKKILKSFVLGHNEVTWNQFNLCKACFYPLLGVARAAHFAPLPSTLLNTWPDALCVSEVLLPPAGRNMNYFWPCVSSGDFFTFSVFSPALGGFLTLISSQVKT